MKKKRLLIFRSCEQQLDLCEEWLHEFASPQEGAWIVSGSRVSADELVRRHSDRSGGLAGFARYSLMQLASELAGPQLARRGLLPLTSLSESAILRRVIDKSLTAQALSYFRPVAKMPGFATAAGQTVNEMQMDLVPVEKLGKLGPAGQDLALLLEAYRRELEKSGLADRREILLQAVAALSARSRPLPVVLLDCRPQSRADFKFVAALVSWAQASLATVQSGDELSLQALQSALGHDADMHSADPVAPATRLECLREQLFEPGGSDNLREEDDSLSFFSAAEESRECVEIVRQIRNSVSDGIRFDEIAILLRQPYLYLPLVEDAFRRAQIPVYMTRGTRRPHPSGRAFLALLQCASEHLLASRFAEYLSLGQVPLPDAKGAPPMEWVQWVAPQTDQLIFKSLFGEPWDEEDELFSLPQDAEPQSPVVAGNLRTPHRWEQLLVDAAVIGGKERWQSRLKGLSREFELQVRGLDPDEEVKRAKLEKRLTYLRHLTNFAIPLITELDQFKLPVKWSVWLQRLERLASMALRWPASVLAVLGELRPMAEVGPVGLEEVEAILAERLKFLNQEPTGNRYGRVFVGSLEEVAGMAFRRVFLPGLAEGIFPCKPKEDAILLDQARARVGLPQSLERMNHRERLRLRTAVSVSSERLTISYPRMELAQGRPRVPSFYFLDVLRAAEGRLPDVQELERRAAAASSTRLGWPAPPEPEQAIDDSEYDLSRLEAALSGKGGKGQARFLLQVNDSLARSLRSRWRRWAKPFSSADGFVNGDPESRELLREESMYRRSFSPTALQNYAVCPYRFFLHAIHRLQPREEPVAIEKMDPLTRGALFHEVQFRLFNQLSKRGQLPIQAANRQAVEAQAEALLKEVADHFFQELAPAIPSIWASEIKGLAADLRGWIRRVAESPGDWIPHRFEYAFGLPVDAHCDQHSQAEPVQIFDGVLLRGSIDLVEFDQTHSKMRVTDHKTGRSPRERYLVVKGGEILQPILYGAVTEALTKKPVLEGRLFYCTQRGDFEVRSVVLDDLNQERARTVLSVIEDSIQQGFLPAAPRKDACRFCDYRTVCGPYEELRVSTKFQESLAPLAKIRELA